MADAVSALFAVEAVAWRSSRQPQHSGNQMIHVERLGHEVVHAGLEGCGLLILEDAGGQGDHREVGQMQNIADLSRCFVAVDDRHLHIHQHDVHAVRRRPQRLQDLAAVRCQKHPSAFVLEDAAGDLAVDVAVVRHQDGEACEPRPFAPAGAFFLLTCPLAAGLADRVVHRGGGHRLGQDGVQQTGVGAAHQILPVVRRDHDDRRWLALAQGVPQATSGGEAVGTWHLPVEQQHVERGAAINRRQRLQYRIVARGSSGRGPAHAAGHLGQDGQRVGMVVGDQHPLYGQGRRRQSAAFLVQCRAVRQS